MIGFVLKKLSVCRKLFVQVGVLGIVVLLGTRTANDTKGHGHGLRRQDAVCLLCKNRIAWCPDDGLVGNLTYYMVPLILFLVYYFI